MRFAAQSTLAQNRTSGSAAPSRTADGRLTAQLRHPSEQPGFPVAPIAKNSAGLGGRRDRRRSDNKNLKIFLFLKIYGRLRA